MKIIVKDKACKAKSIKLPALLQCNDAPELIVLGLYKMNSQNFHGIVLRDCGPYHPLEALDHWALSKFSEFNGSITLEQ